jgi:uncharacterized membrane protein
VWGWCAVAPFRTVARQSIPRVDLYGELGVDPSADSDAIEAAYRELIERQPEGGGPGDVRRTARLRLARDWLTDTERRNRYDASRARAAVRAAGKQATRPHFDVPWPAADLARAEAEAAEEAARAAAETTIAWSATPPDPMPASAAYAAAPPASAPVRRRSRGPAVALGRVILVLAVAIATYLIAANLGWFNTAVSNPTATPQAQTPAPPSPTVATTLPPSIAPTTAPTAPGPSGVPLAVIQQGAFDTIQALIAAAKAGDVAAAQRYLGDSAPGLRASGLAQATFPLLEGPGAIGMARDGESYLAVLDDGTQLTSPDGLTWTFPYGNRPLAAYRSSGKDIRDLWWTETDGKHHLYLRVTVATFSPQTVTATLTWTFDPARPDDATYFRRAAIDLTSLSFDDQPPVLIATQPVGIVDSTFVMTSAMLATPYAGDIPSQLVLEITVTNPRREGGAGREIPTTYTIPVR